MEVPVHKAYTEVLKEILLEEVLSSSPRKILSLPPPPQQAPALQVQPPVVRVHKQQDDFQRDNLWKTFFLVFFSIAFGFGLGAFVIGKTSSSVTEVPVSSAQDQVQETNVEQSKVTTIETEIGLIKKILAGLVQSVQTLSKTSLEEGQTQELWREQEFPLPMKVSVDKAHIRKGPNRAEESIGAVEKDTVLLALEERNGWLKVNTPKGEEGWISGDLLKENQP